MERLPNIHPGEVLLEDFIKPNGLSIYQVAKATCMSQTRVTEIIRGRRSITADTALRLARFFGNSPHFWMGLQDDYDLESAWERIGPIIDKMEPLARNPI